MAIRFDEIEFSGTSNHYYPVLKASGGVIRVDTATGYLDIGSANTSYAHITTDRPTFYFNNNVSFDGNIAGYGTDETATFATFYDSNNTGYYINPYGQSKIRNNNAQETLIIEGDYPQLTIRRTSIADASIHFDAGFSKKFNVGPGAGGAEEDEFGFAIYSGPRGTHYGTPLRISADTGYVQVGDKDHPAYQLDILGTAYSSADFRAPVFYDSNNTAYHVDPNGTSDIHDITMHSATATHFGIANSSTSTRDGISLYGGATGGEPTYGLLFTGTSGFGTYGSVTSDWATYFTMNNNDARGWIFRKAGVGNTSSISAGGVATFGSSTQSPIFYDSADTTYYIDPASNGSKIKNLVIVPQSQSWSEGIRFDMPNQNVWGGLRWSRSGASGNSANWALGYAGNESTDDMTWWSGTGNHRWRLDHSGNVTVQGSSRAPVFYDSNDTNYYLDPNTTGTSLNAAGKLIGSNINTFIKYLGVGVSYDTDRSTKVNNGIALYGAYNGGSNSPHTYDFSAQFVGNARGFELSAAWHAQTALYIRTLRDCCQNWSSWYALAIHGLNPGTSAGALYAGAFYDSGSTAYFNDMANSSLSSRQLGPSEYRSSAGNTRGYIQATENNDQHFIIATSGGEDIAFKDGGLGGTTNMIIRGDGDVNVPGFITTPKIIVTTGSLGSSDAGTKGLIMHGNYTDGKYAHRFRKQDLGGNVVLFLDQSAGTANSFTQLMRFGHYSGNSHEFEVFGDIKATIDMHAGRYYDANDTTYYTEPGDGSKMKWVGINTNPDTGSAGVHLKVQGGTNGIRGVEIYSGTYSQGLYVEAPQYGQPAQWNYAYVSGNLNTMILHSFMFAGTAKGSISVTSTSTSFNTTSDYRLKENLIDITDGITRVKQLQPKRFNFIGDTQVLDGFIAHEAQSVVPEAVTGTQDEVDHNNEPVYQGIDQAKLVPLLTAALKEAIQKIEDLEARVQTLENQ